MNAKTTSKSLDYKPCRYGDAKLMFRGPAKRLHGEYVAFIGSTETFGRFIEVPFPELVEKQTRMTAVNLGCIQAGVDAFFDSEGLMEIASMSEVTVVQVMGAPHMSNRLYTVDSRYNERFIRASRALKSLYPEVNFAEIDLVPQLLSTLARVGPDRLATLRREVQDAWVYRMRSFLKQIRGPKILLWIADHAPYSNASGGTICRDPLFVDRGMINAVKDFADDYVEIVATKDDIEEGRKRMIFDPMELASAREMLGPVAHDRAAEALTPIILRLSQASQEDDDFSLFA